MIELTRNFYFVFGALTILGGLLGFVKAKSTASLVAGGISGALIIVAAVLLASNPTAGLVLGAVISVALLGRFLPAFLKTKKVMPAGMMAVLSAASVVITVLAFVKK